MRQDGFWHFQCPECSMGDAELGWLAADQELHCEVCAEERHITVRLCRWPSEPDQSRSRVVLAA